METVVVGPVGWAMDRQIKKPVVQYALWQQTSLCSVQFIYLGVRLKLPDICAVFVEDGGGIAIKG